MPTARRTILRRARHDARTFADRLPFVTAAGRVDRVVTPRCVFRRVDGALRVESLRPGTSPDELRPATGFPLTVNQDIPRTPVPTGDELRALQEIDPEGTRRLG
jgi:glutaconate CoA-transferase subunit B